ncbi:MAG TPA: hypothetical protein VFE29_08805 [Terriglobia bacterium]|nr:hypothetical protein [Terriglobia bacterium]
MWSRMACWPPYGLIFVVFLEIMAGGCARLPYTTKVIHEDRRAIISLQRDPAATVPYTHPVQLRGDELSAVLAGFSFREKQRLPLRWFAEEVPPKKIFRADEMQAVVPFLVEGLESAAPDERVYFQVLAPGMNPAAERDATAGWIAVREPYLYLVLEHYHAQFPIRKSEQWDLRYPTTPPEPKTYVLYFEPGRFWETDPVSSRQAVQLREFLKSAIPASR